MADLPRVALIVRMSGTYCRQILEGVNRYLKAHLPWSVFLDWRQADVSMAWFRHAHWDGCICRVADQKLLRLLRRRGIPTVSLSQAIASTAGLPHIRSDNHAVGRLAAEHFLQRKVRHFAFCGQAEPAWSRRPPRGICPNGSPSWIFLRGLRIRRQFPGRRLGPRPEGPHPLAGRADQARRLVGLQQRSRAGGAECLPLVRNRGAGPGGGAGR